MCFALHFFNNQVFYCGVEGNIKEDTKPFCLFTIQIVLAVNFQTRLSED